MQVTVPLPPATQGLDKAEVEPFEFTSDEEVGHGHAGLGSGRQFSTLADHSQVRGRSGTCRTGPCLPGRLCPDERQAVLQSGVGQSSGRIPASATPRSGL